MKKNNMENPLRQYIFEIGSILGKLGYDLCQQANNTNQPMNVHGHVSQTLNHLTYYLHNINADLDTWRKEMLDKDGEIKLPTIFEGTDGVDVESINCAVHHLLYSKTYDVDSGNELEFTEELRKLEWLCEELQNTPDVLRNSKATYNDFSFD